MAKTKLLRFLCLTVSISVMYIVVYAYQHRFVSNSLGRRTSEVRMFTTNVEQIETQTKPSQCYRQLQIWFGPESPQAPAEVVDTCPGSDCGYILIKDTSLETMKKSDVVVHDVLRSTWDWARMQRIRLPNQPWAFWSMEARALPDRQFEHLYNFTMTHRRESTIVTPYGIFDNTPPASAQDQTKNWADGRTNMVAWVVSNCHDTTWKRYEFVQKLSQHIQVDIYGACGKPGCERGSTNCWEVLSTYKFYLALENSECQDYITEKLWENSLLHGILPIVYGAPKEDYERVAPPNSFIYLADFNSMDEFVTYLQLLNSNDTMYNSYFEWKRQGSISGLPWQCRMSALLGNLKKSGAVVRANKTVFDKWQKQCVSRTGFPNNIL